MGQAGSRLRFSNSTVLHGAHLGLGKRPGAAGSDLCQFGEARRRRSSDWGTGSGMEAAAVPRRSE